jgi:predicted nucleic acid-binding protein
LILIDTNVLLDLATDDPRWLDWSARAMESHALNGPLWINPIIYAELSARYERFEAVEEFVQGAGVQVIDIPRSAAFLAAKAFARYRASGGAKTGVLSDFFIGAHAAVLEIPLLTRDVGRYRTYFPKLRIFAPQAD